MWGGCKLTTLPCTPVRCASLTEWRGELTLGFNLGTAPSLPLRASGRLLPGDIRSSNALCTRSSPLNRGLRNRGLSLLGGLSTSLWLLGWREDSSGTSFCVCSTPWRLLKTSLDQEGGLADRIRGRLPSREISSSVSGPWLKVPPQRPAEGTEKKGETFNSLAPVGCGCNLKLTYFKLIVKPIIYVAP